MSEQKIFINNDNAITFECLKCKKKIAMDFSKYTDMDEILMLEYRCKCGYSASVLVERRKFHRKEVSLSGKYILCRGKIKGSMTLKDLSRGGLKFELEAERDMKIGDKVFVVFRLDDGLNTLIKKDVFIRSVSNLNIGAEFCMRNPRSPVDAIYDRAITHYILNAQLLERSLRRE
ncbi:MAG TPA: PilZ domain-containing protein [Desulfobacterales bacterium]|nr:PilZ domain-containing protein [Desulfobacterales bacterium]